MEIIEKLGLSLQSFLFHMLSLAILVFAAWLLLHKPISKIIKKQNKHLSDIDEENKKLVAEAEENRRGIDAIKRGAKEEAIRITSAAQAAASAKADEALEDAKSRARIILEAAHKEANSELDRVMGDYHKRVADASVEIAEKILMREITRADNQKIIDDCVRELLS